MNPTGDGHTGDGPPGVGPEDDVEMSFFEHLHELRRRLTFSILGLLPGAMVAWVFKERLLELLLEPYIRAWVALDLGAPVVHMARAQELLVEYMWMAAIAGVFLGAPVIFWQFWLFISPGLYRREKLLALPFVIASTVCFIGGAYFCYEIVLPMALDTFLGLTGALPSGQIEVQPTIMVAEYLTFVTKMLLAFGVVFEVPVITTFLAAAGIVDYKMLLGFSRWWVLVATLLAAFLTPPDVISQLVMLVPLVVLYFASIGIAYLIHLSRRKKSEAEDDQPGAA